MKLPHLKEIELAYLDLRREGVMSPLIETEHCFLKAENLLPTSSYKIRGVKNYLRKNAKNLSRVRVLSAGNLALAMAHQCREERIRCEVIVPEGISEAKKDLILMAQAKCIEIPFATLFNLVLQPPDELDQDILHPMHPDLLCGYGTIALEILDQAPGCKGIIAPYGLGGLILSLAHTLKALGQRMNLYSVEILNHSPFFQSRFMGVPSRVPKIESFIEAMGAPTVIDEVFHELQNHKLQSVLISQNMVKEAIKEVYIRHQLIVEGAAGAAYAGSLMRGNKDTVALLTGGNIRKDLHESLL